MPPTPGLGLRGRAVRGPFGDAQVHAVPALIAANHTRSKAADSTDPEMHLGSAQRPPRRAASMGSSGLQRSASCCGSSRRSAAPSSRCSSGIATPTLRGAARSGMERGHDMPNGARSRARVLGRRGIIQGGRGQHGRTARDARVEILPRAAACTARIGKRRPLRSRSRGFRGEVPTSCAECTPEAGGELLGAAQAARGVSFVAVATGNRCHFSLCNTNRVFFTTLLLRRRSRACFSVPLDVSRTPRETAAHCERRRPLRLSPLC